MDDRSRWKPTKAELDILQVLWKQGPSTVRDVHSSLSEEREIGYTTVLKTMQIMADKGILVRNEQGKAHIYAPSESEGAAKSNLVLDLMDRAFGGSASELIMHALSSKAASAEELSEIRQILAEMEKQK